ncbi:MAG TPA: hypothetical protein VHB79_00245 [Polyangiaceae bacterium]|nr:hypothetical protein [Polyangiaceae bacterium]
MEPPGDAVKEAKPVGKTWANVAERNLGQLLQGWEAGGITVGLVLSAVLLSVPRAARPVEFPVPLVDTAEAEANRQRSDELADAAERAGLPFETRAVGDVVRRWGAALSSGVGDPEQLNRLTRERVEAALRADQRGALRQLRAVQARMFVRAVRDYDWSGPVPAELRDLGGDFAERARKSGWVERRHCIATDDELAALFGVRWLELTRLRDHVDFRPTLGDWRRYYRFLLLYPEQGGAGAAERRLRYAEALAKRDGDYPIGLVRGTLLLQLGRNQASARELSAHLGQGRGAEWQLRARNYLLSAARDAAEIDEE